MGTSRRGQTHNHGKLNEQLTTRPMSMAAPLGWGNVTAPHGSYHPSPIVPVQNVPLMRMGAMGGSRIDRRTLCASLAWGGSGS